MIEAAIQTVTQKLNSFLRFELDLSEDVVILSNVLEQDGSMAPNVENKITVFVINVEKDTTPETGRTPQANSSNRVPLYFSPVFINIYLVFACNFSGKNYAESLKFLSHTICFFQRHPVWDHQNTPEMDKRIDKLCIEIENLDIKDLSNLWGVISSKYMPSVIYKIRTFEISSVALKERAFKINAPKQTVEN